MGSSDMQPWQVSVVFWVLFVVAFLRGLRLVEAMVFCARSIILAVEILLLEAFFRALMRSGESLGAQWVTISTGFLGGKLDLLKGSLRPLASSRFPC